MPCQSSPTKTITESCVGESTYKLGWIGLLHDHNTAELLRILASLEPSVKECYFAYDSSRRRNLYYIVQTDDSYAILSVDRDTLSKLEFYPKFTPAVKAILPKNRQLIQFNIGFISHIFNLLHPY